jgi:hypothetical protein
VSIIFTPQVRVSTTRTRAFRGSTSGTVRCSFSSTVGDLYDVPLCDKLTHDEGRHIGIDRSVAVQNSDLWWTLTFTDPGGTAWTLVNFPLF